MDRQRDPAWTNQLRAEGVFSAAAGDRRDSGVVYRKVSRPTVGAESQVALDGRDVHPQELQALLAPNGSASHDEAWDAFVARHSRLLLHVARKVMPASESAMDAYAHLLERLRRDDCRALRGYAPDGRSMFTTWLVVVSRRMCVDFYRQRYGRPRSETPTRVALVEREARHRLEAFVGVDDALSQIADNGRSPDSALRNGQLHQALDRVVAELASDDQLLLKLRFDDNLSAQRIATVLKFPSQFHVYRRLKTICAELRRRLVERGIEDSTP